MRATDLPAILAAHLALLALLAGAVAGAAALRPARAVPVAPNGSGIILLERGS
ncbi:hypothetical protein [Methylobacterium nodulans]|uniref:Uncharacterized protein n=1 Tax=Methylobacterium nodulans (strain LMG 21967 / CNCM I-2342 / ORS 2060) TaxID=460265 RepID=B8INW6_METNO|nr:hypothetical protein [Methylobacterium nodulans]ACL58482.1 hypothetical protein Mnod_3573 [Methylobacterium nodulans ORS 2060]